MRTTALALPALLAVAFALGACSTGASPRPLPTSPAVASESVLSSFVDDGQPGCSVAVGRLGDVVWSAARGLADVETGEALTTSSVLDMASVSKQFTATAVLLLEQDGTLSLSDSLATWVAGLPADASGITLADLLHHTSGIPDFIPLLLRAKTSLVDSVTEQDALDALAALPRLRRGSEFAYSNSNYVLLAQVVESASGMPLDQFLDERVFGPLHLDMRLQPFYDGSNVAQSYEHGRPLNWGWQLLGPGYVYSTPSELVRWADNYRTGELGGAALLEAQLADGAADQDNAYAAGIVIEADGTLSHGGSWEGYRTGFSISADRSTAIAVMCNSAEADAVYLEGRLREIWFE